VSTLNYRDATAADVDLLVDAMVVAVNRMRPSGEEVTTAEVRTPGRNSPTT